MEGKKFLNKCIGRRSNAGYPKKQFPKKLPTNKVNKEIGENFLVDLEVEMDKDWLDALIEGVDRAHKKDKPAQ